MGIYSLRKFRQKVVSFPGSDLTLRFPPWRSIICFDMLKPIPEPSFLVVKNGTKISSIRFSGIPCPLSDTRISGLFSGSFPADIVIVLSGLSAFASIAFFKRFMRTREIWFSSANNSSSGSLRSIVSFIFSLFPREL
jgi:hypothetical protein